MADIAIPITGLYAGILGILLILLSINVTRNRVRSKIMLFDGVDPALGRAIRAQGNFIEYVPAALLLVAVAELGGAPALALHAAGIVLVVARLLHAWALSRGTEPSFGRLVGTLGTWIVIGVGAVYAIYLFLGG